MPVAFPVALILEELGQSAAGEKAGRAFSIGPRWPNGLMKHLWGGRKVAICEIRLKAVSAFKRDLSFYIRAFIPRETWVVPALEFYFNYSVFLKKRFERELFMKYLIISNRFKFLVIYCVRR